MKYNLLYFATQRSKPYGVNLKNQKPLKHRQALAVRVFGHVRFSPKISLHGMIKSYCNENNKLARSWFFGFELEGNLFQKVGKRSASEMLFIAEQVVDFFGIGLPIVHKRRFCFMPIVGNKNIHNLDVFREPI